MRHKYNLKNMSTDDIVDLMNETDDSVTFYKVKEGEIAFNTDEQQGAIVDNFTDNVYKITDTALVLMEKASRLKVTTGFELSILNDRKHALLMMSRKAVITDKQLEVIRDMAIRYDEATHLITSEDLPKY